MKEEKILKSIEGIFNGKGMVVSEGCEISVPENYASKSMILAGARMVYHITNQRSYFKQLDSPEPATAIGIIVPKGGTLVVEALVDDRQVIFKFLSAFRSYHRLTIGDEVVIAYPEKLSILDENWCIIENKIS